MENTFKSFENQSILDIAVQYTGSVSNAFAIAEANNKCIADNISAGEIFTIPSFVKIDVLILKEYQTKHIKPATGTASTKSWGTIEIDVPALSGIGYMRIGSIFKVS